MYKEQLDSCECLLPVAKITNEVFEYQKIILPSEFFQEVLTGCLQILNKQRRACDLGLENQNTGVSSLSLLQGIFPTQGSNSGLLHCRLILYQPSHKESPRILEWVAYSFSRGSSRPRVELGSPALQADSLPTEL